jgi:hypothetical protein
MGVRRLVWLASYPRSGNTWVLSMLAELAATTGALTLAVGSDRLTLERWSGLDLAALPADVARRVRADVWRDVADAAPHPVVVKVHDPFADADRGGVIPVEVTHAVLYVVRHPADVVASLSPFVGTDVDTAIELLADRGAAGGGPRMVDDRDLLGSWSDHVTGWLQAPVDVHVIRYEDLVRDPVAGLTAAVAAIGTPCPEPAVEDAVRACRFDLLRAREDETGSPLPASGRDRFFRHGRSGQGDELLSVAQAARLRDDHGHAMALVGYE